MVRKVLFVDDDQIMLLAIEKRFTAHSDYFSMIMAKDGFDAVQKLKEHTVSLIVLDLKMPRMDGMSLLTHTREKYPDIPVIIVSGYRTAEMYKLAKAKGVIAYISKPFQVDDLGKIILSTLQKEAAGGIMHNVSPTVFLQLMEMEAKTCTIRILDKKSGKGGILYFTDGKLLDVRVGEETGIDAAYQVFSWDEVTLFIENDCISKKNVINSDLQPIIMKAVGMKDESEETDDEAFEEEDVDSEENEEPWEPDLGDIELPEELKSEEEEEAEVEPELQATTPPAPQPQARSQQKPKDIPEAGTTEKIQTLLRTKVGPKAGIESIQLDDSYKEMVKYLGDLGSLLDLGSFQAGYIATGKEADRIIIPGEKTTVLNVSSKCPKEKVLKVLSDSQ